MIKKALTIITIVIFSLVVTKQNYAVGNFAKYPLNPIISFQPAEPASVIKDNNIYKMWFTTNYGYGWRINYAYSLDGINNWTIPNQVVIPVGSSDGLELDTTNPVVLYNASLRQYQMWYVSVLSNWQSGTDKFRLRYATSNDGLNWTKTDLWALEGTSNSWDTGGISAATIVYNNGLYQMWYSGTNEGVNWKIGYATSTDGINWVKENNGQPVITATKPWELNNQVQSPNVIFSNGVYEMFYATNDPPTQLAYATSTDGINWDKPQDKNPILIATANGFDNLMLTGPVAMRSSDGTTMLWYTGNAYYALLASDGSFTPSPEATATPTPTPTPAPTPTPIPVTKAVVVPGMGASWNPDAILGCKLDNYSGAWGPMPQYGLMYNNIVTALQNNGFTTSVFYYDWRQPIKNSASSLNQYISNLTAADEKVDLVGHSMGGLVGNGYLEATKENNKLDHFISVGSPFKGSILSYPPWSAGKIWNDDMKIRIAATIVEKFCGARSIKDDRIVIRTLIPSFQDTLPTFPYLFPNHSNTPKQPNTMDAKNDWLPSHLVQPPFFGVTVGSLIGTGVKTVDKLDVRAANPIDRMWGNWKDGDPIQKHFSNNGDGTVLQSSATLDGATNIVINKNHGSLIASNEGVQKIISFLKGSQAIQQLRQAQPELPSDESALVVIGYPGQFTVEDPQGFIMKDKQNLVILSNPKNGRHTLRITPTKDETQIVVGQFLSDGRTFWKEYKDKGRQTRTHKLFFDKNNPREDPLD